MDKGRIEAVCVSARKGEKKTPTPRVEVKADHGIVGDAHAARWHRQISLLATADVDTLRARGLPDLKAGDFAENLLVSGLALADLGLGSRLQVGAEVTLSVSQRGKVCHSRCAIFAQTGDCVMPRRGIFARVLSGGTVAAGDSVRVLTAVSPALFQAVVVTVSDRCSRGEAEDTAGPAVGERLTGRGMFHVYNREVVPDDETVIAERLRHYANGHSIDLVLAVGGTGFAPRDVTPEAVRQVIQRATPGLDEAMRAASATRTPHAMLSRAVSGIRGGTLIVSLPGSRRAATENLEALLPALPHGLAKLRGDAGDCAPERRTP